jgi:hypothetical protein
VLALMLLVNVVGVNAETTIDPNVIGLGVAPEFDVVFLVDNTGSMGDEIRSVKTHIINIAKEVQQGTPAPKIRIGVVTYRDHGDGQDLLGSFEINEDVDAALRYIEDIEAIGGGDYPEAVDVGLKHAVESMNWKQDNKKIMFLIGDAPSHVRKLHVDTAVQKEITIYTISGSGMDERGVEQWKYIADATGGKYEALSYVRQDLDQYAREEGIDAKYVEEARADADYDKETNSIVTNSLNKFAVGALREEARDAGVKYEAKDPCDLIFSPDCPPEKDKKDKETIKFDENGKAINYEEIFVKEISFNETLKNFFRNFLENISFWR